MRHPPPFRSILSLLTCWSLGVTGKTDPSNPAHSSCFDLTSVVLHPQSPMAPWATPWPPTAAEHMKNEECFCETEIPTQEEINETHQAIQLYAPLAEYDALYVHFIHLLEREKLNSEEAALDMKKYCDEQLKFFDTAKAQNTPALAFAPSKALDYILHWLASHRLWGSTREFFTRGMLNFESKLDNWLELAKQKRLAAVYTFIHYLQNGYDFQAASDTLQELSWIKQFQQLPSRLNIRNCIVVSPNRHEFFKPFMTSPLAAWMKQVEPHIMAVLQKHQGIVCREQFEDERDFRRAAEWDTHELQIAALEKMIAVSTALMQEPDNKKLFEIELSMIKTLITTMDFSLHPSEALDYTIGLLRARRHLAPEVKKLILKGMLNYGDLRDWLRLAQDLQWHFVERLVHPYTQSTQHTSANLFAKPSALFVVGGDSLARPPHAG